MHVLKLSHVERQRAGSILMGCNYMYHKFVVCGCIKGLYNIHHGSNTVLPIQSLPWYYYANPFVRINRVGQPLGTVWVSVSCSRSLWRATGIHKKKNMEFHDAQLLQQLPCTDIFMYMFCPLDKRDQLPFCHFPLLFSHLFSSLVSSSLFPSLILSTPSDDSNSSDSRYESQTDIWRFQPTYLSLCPFSSSIRLFFTLSPSCILDFLSLCKVCSRQGLSLLK